MIVKVAHLIAIQHDSIHDTLSTTDIYNMFSEFLVQFERMERSGTATTKQFLDAVEEIVRAVLLILPQKLLHTRILLHPLLLFLRQMLISLLDNYSISRLPLKIQEKDLLLNIIFIFVRIAEQATTINTDKNKKIKRDLLKIKEFLLKVRERSDFVVRNQVLASGDSSICSLALLTLKLITGYPFNYNLGKHQQLIHFLVMDWLDSYDFKHAADRLENGDLLTDVEFNVLLICWEYICSTFLIKQDCSTQTASITFIYDVCDEILTRLEDALDQPPPIAPEALAHIFKRIQELLNVNNLPTFDKHAQNIIDRLTKFLKNPLPTNANDEALIIVSLQTFYNLSKNDDIRAIMRMRHLTYIFHKYESNEVGEKQKLAIAILAEIMDENEINENPTEMTSFYIEQLEQLNPNEYNPSLDNILSSLNAFMQYEQIKVEFLKQGGLDLLIPFIREGDTEKKSDQQLVDILQILWSFTFDNPDITNKLKQDEKLMTRVNDILEKSKKNQNSTLEKAAEGLIWKVEKEEKFLEERAAQSEKKKKEKKKKAAETGVEEDDEDEEEAPKYDLMISYSWADMDLAHRIFNHLTEKLGYKVWIDKEQMHGSTIEAMANAVDGAEFILLCMSEPYKRSANCKSEAEYAFNRKKHIVPIKMKKDYVPDGWLGFILGTRMYIDFGKREFDKAIELLDNEIQLQKKKRGEDKESMKREKKIEIDNGSQVDAKNDVQSHHDTIEETIDLDNILNWNENAVRNFLMRNNLTDFLAIFNGINGSELCKLYAMCKKSPVLMYRSLKSELLKVHEQVLPISIFLHFMRCLATVDVDYFSIDEYSHSSDSEQDLSNNV